MDLSSVVSGACTGYGAIRTDYSPQHVIDYGQYDDHSWQTSDTVVEEYEYYPDGRIKRKKVTRTPGPRTVQPWVGPRYPYTVTC